jgi:hypothetical protein
MPAARRTSPAIIGATSRVAVAAACAASVLWAAGDGGGTDPAERACAGRRTGRARRGRGFVAVCSCVAVGADAGRPAGWEGAAGVGAGAGAGDGEVARGVAVEAAGGGSGDGAACGGRSGAGVCAPAGPASARLATATASHR